MSMITIILEAHSGWRYIVLLLLVVALLKFAYGLLTSSRWSNLDDGLNRFVPIALDIQVLLGLILWIVMQQWKNYNPLAAWEHPFTMLIVLAIAHVGSIRAKRLITDKNKYLIATMWTVLALLILLLGIYRINEGSIL